MEDNKIIELFFNRSEDALKELDASYGKLSHKLANNILNNPSDSEECVNDAYLGVWNSIPPERPVSLMAYLCKVVRNLALKKLRYNTAEKRNSNMSVALDELENCLAASSDVEKQMEETELSAAINEFLGKLKQSDRVVFMKRYYFSQSYGDIASEMGLSEKNVSVKLSRVRGQLREYLKTRNYI